MNFKTILAPAVALTMALVNPLQAKAELTPYQHIAMMVTWGKCLIEYGYTQEQVNAFLVPSLRAGKYSNQQVSNIVDGPKFQDRVKKYTADLGGCGQVVSKLEAEMEKRLGTVVY